MPGIRKKCRDLSVEIVSFYQFERHAKVTADEVPGKVKLCELNF